MNIMNSRTYIYRDGGLHISPKLNITGVSCLEQYHWYSGIMSVLKVKVQDICIVKLSTFLSAFFFILSA